MKAAAGILNIPFKTSHLHTRASRRLKPWCFTYYKRLALGIPYFVNSCSRLPASECTTGFDNQAICHGTGGLWSQTTHLDYPVSPCTSVGIYWQPPSSRFANLGSLGGDVCKESGPNCDWDLSYVMNLGVDIIKNKKVEITLAMLPTNFLSKFY